MAMIDLSTKSVIMAANNACNIIRGHRYYLDTLLVRKISKRHFLKDIENSFQEVTQIGPEPRHFFSFSNISTNRVARDFQNFGRNGP